MIALGHDTTLCTGTGLGHLTTTSGTVLPNNLHSINVVGIGDLAVVKAGLQAPWTGTWLSVSPAAYPLLVMVVASCGMAPMARNMMLKKETPKMARDPVAVLSIPLKRDPMIRDMITTWINLCKTKHIC